MTALQPGNANLRYVKGEPRETIEYHGVKMELRPNAHVSAYCDLWHGGKRITCLARKDAQQAVYRLVDGLLEKIT